MTTQTLAEQFAKKPGLPYLLSTKPLRRTIAKMVDDAGYTYWDETTGTAYWVGDEDDRPNNWNKANPLTASPDVKTAISDSDIKIGDEYVVYTDIEALLDDHADEIQPPESDTTECEVCGTEVDPVGNPPYYCGDHQPSKPTCSECGNEVDSESDLNARGVCSDCAGIPDWQESTSLMAASRAFNEVRTAALSEAPTGKDPGVSRVTIEVGGEDQLSKASFISQRQALKDRSEAASIRMQYETKSDSGASYTATFTGGIDEFTRVTNQPEPFGGSERIDVKFRIELNEPEIISDDENDVLAELNNDLGQTNIDLKVEARGPTRVAEEVDQ